MTLTHWGVLIGFLMVSTACSTAAQPARTQVPTDVVATIGQGTVTLAELDERALNQPAGRFGTLTLAQALYEARRAALDELVGDRLIDREATARGVERAMLVEQEITAKVATPSPADVEAWYKSNPTRVQGATLDQIRKPIADLLVAERTEVARSRLVDALKAKTRVILSLEPPRLNVSDAGRPAKGPSDAPVTLIEFSDFQCPFCQRASSTVAQVLATYGNKIRFVYRHYPLPNHPAATPSAEASLCAAEQDQFWAFHDRLFANPSKLEHADLKQHAADLELDTAKFNACVDSRKYQEDVEADLAAGNALGVNGTPAFFINGRVLSGAQPFDAFKAIIDDELGR